MSRGPFYEPRPLRDLDTDGLLAYSKECERALRHIQQEFAYLDGRRAALSEGFALDGVLVGVGIVLAGAGVVGIAVFTFGGLVTLAGGALSLLGAHRYGDRFIERSLLIDQVRSRRATIEYLRQELRRIGTELERRR